MPQPIYLPRRTSSMEQLLPYLSKYAFMKMEQKQATAAADKLYDREKELRKEERDYQREFETEKQAGIRETSLQQATQVPIMSIGGKPFSVKRSGDKVVAEPYNDPRFKDTPIDTRTNNVKDYEYEVGLHKQAVANAQATGQPIPKAPVFKGVQPNSRSEEQARLLSKDVLNAEEKIISNESNPAARAHIRYFNNNAPDDVAYTYIWRSPGSGFFGPKNARAIRVDFRPDAHGRIPTMADIRKTAKDNRLTIERTLEILGYIDANQPVSR